MREAFASKLQASVAERERRAGNLPRATLDDNLPIAAHADDIVELIRRHQVVRSPAKPAAARPRNCPSCACAPVAAPPAWSAAPSRAGSPRVRWVRRVAEELQVPLGGAVGYQVRFNDNVGENTAIKFMTDEVLKR